MAVSPQGGGSTQTGYDFLSAYDHNAVVDVNALGGGGNSCRADRRDEANSAESITSMGINHRGAQAANEQPQDFVDALNNWRSRLVARPSWSSLTARRHPWPSGHHRPRVSAPPPRHRARHLQCSGTIVWSGAGAFQARGR